MPSVVQQGVYGTAASHYFYPALCPDNGNATMVFSRSGAGEGLYLIHRATFDRSARDTSE